MRGTILKSARHEGRQVGSSNWHGYSWELGSLHDGRWERGVGGEVVVRGLVGCRGDNFAYFSGDDHRYVCSSSLSRIKQAHTYDRIKLSVKNSLYKLSQFRKAKY